MRKLNTVIVFVVASSAVACSFEMSAGRKAPNATQAAPPAPAAAAPAPSPRPTVATLGRRGTPAPAATAPAATAPVATPGLPVLIGTNVFGQGTPDVAGWKGSLYMISPATQAIPALATMTPSGVLFARELNVSSRPMTGGFPGIDATRNEAFAIRWEAPLLVDNEADYTFRIVSDDGSAVSIDGMKIVDNDGQHTSKESSGPVHLVRGTHLLTVDYFQATGPVALQLFCKKAGGSEVVCPTRL